MLTVEHGLADAQLRRTLRVVSPSNTETFVEGIGEALGIDWETDDVVQLYADGDLDRARVLSYSYPESRLAPAEEVEKP